MKNIFTFILAITLSTLSIDAQIDVKEGDKAMREGTFNAYTVSLDNISEDEAKDGWEKFIAEYKGKVKRDKKANLYSSENIDIPEISSNPLDVYTMISENKNYGSTTVSVWFDTGNGYVNSTNMSTQSQIANRMLVEYSKNVLRKNAEENQTEQEDILKKLTKNANKLDDKNKDLRKDIAKAKANILRWEKELSQNEGDIENTNNKIKNQESVVNKAKAHTRKY